MLSYPCVNGDDETATSPIDAESWKPQGSPCIELLVPERRLIPIPEGSTILGRDPGPNGITLRYPGVSRHHAQLTRATERSISLMDLGSKNGTMVDGTQITVHPLLDGDRISLGSSVELRLSYTQLGPQGSVALTSREREVASLVAAGLTNKQIGERLGITRHGVDSLLRSAFKRTGAKSRAALVAWTERKS